MAWEKVGAVLRGKKGNYIKIQKNVTLKEGQTLQLFDPRKSKYITEERLAKIPEFVRMEIFIAPDDEEKKEPQS